MTGVAHCGRAAEALSALGRQIAMHIAAAAPQWNTVDEVDADALERERTVLSEQARAEGDFAEAVRCHYRAGAQRLIEAGRAPDAPGITVKGLEHRVEARDDRELLALRSVSDAFEEVWYGGRDADADLADTVGQDARRVGVTATVDETGSS